MLWRLHAETAEPGRAVGCPTALPNRSPTAVLLETGRLRGICVGLMAYGTVFPTLLQQHTSGQEAERNNTSRKTINQGVRAAGCG